MPDIKRAYARLLKQTHPEDNPEGFLELRRAYDAALRGHRPAFVPPKSPSQAGAPEPSRPSTSEAEATPKPAEPKPAEPLQPPIQSRIKPAPTVAAPLPKAPPRLDPEREALAAQQLKLAHLLRDTEASDDARLDAFHAVIRSPAMGDVGLYQDVELWLAHQIASNSPRSDDLIGRAISSFSWQRLQDRLDTPQAIAWVLGREAVAVQVARVKNRKSQYYKAGRWLQKPLPKGFLGYLIVANRARRMRPLLKLMAGNPGMDNAFDAELLKRWRDYCERTPPRRDLVWRFVRRVLWGLFFIFLLGSVGALLGSRNDSQTGRTAAAATARTCRSEARTGVNATAAIDICTQALNAAPDRALAIMGDRGLAALRAGKPEQAKSDFQYVLSRSPYDARALAGMGFALMQGDPPLEGPAKLDFGHSLASDPAALTRFSQSGFTPPLPVRPAALKPYDFGGPTHERSQLFTPPAWAVQPTPGQMTPYLSDQAQRDGVAGSVKLTCAIDADGTVKDCYVLSEQPQDEGLADSAIAVATHAAKFKPAQVDGKPTGGYRVTIPFVFSKP